MLTFEVGDTALVKLSLVMASRRDGATGRIVLRVPSNARIVDMSYSQGGAQVVASSQPSDEARLKFEATEHGVVDWRTLGRPTEVRVPAVRDPALLEWTSADIDRKNYRLSVFPMSSFELTTGTSLGRGDREDDPRHRDAPCGEAQGSRHEGPPA